MLKLESHRHALLVSASGFGQATLEGRNFDMGGTTSGCPVSSVRRSGFGEPNRRGARNFCLVSNRHALLGVWPVLRRRSRVGVTQSGGGTKF